LSRDFILIKKSLITLHVGIRAHGFGLRCSKLRARLLHVCFGRVDAGGRLRNAVALGRRAGARSADTERACCTPAAACRTFARPVTRVSVT